MFYYKLHKVTCECLITRRPTLVHAKQITITVFNTNLFVIFFFLTNEIYFKIKYFFSLCARILGTYL